MSTSLLEMNHIKKEFDGLLVLKDVSIHVNEGEVVSISVPQAPVNPRFFAVRHC